MLGDKLFVYHDNAPLMLKFCIKNHKVILEDHCGILEHELNCYQQYIGEALAKKNERKVKYRHKDQCKSIEQLYESKNTAPEEQLFYLGGKSEHVDPEILLKHTRGTKMNLQRYMVTTLSFCLRPCIVTKWEHRTYILGEYI
jgi:hypothetical protein